MQAAKKRIKDDVLNLRTTPEQKELIQKAAQLLGVSAASFILENSLKAARAELSAVDVLKLAKNDAEAFFDALENPKTPHPAIVSAFKSYEKNFKR
jgi:uncharacterized protein (DUF1778 family)